MQDYEALELAGRVLGIDTEADDFDEDAVEQALWEKYEISMEHFQKIAELLIPFTYPAQTMGTELWQGYVADGAFICKQPSTLKIG